MTKTALIADDDSAIRGMLGRVLRSLGWNTLEAADGCSALDKISTHRVDLLILDQVMPQLTGSEVLSVIRGSETHANLPVMVVTGASDAETSQIMLSLGVADYLVKPLRADFVRKRLARLDKTIRPGSSQRRTDVEETVKEIPTLVVVDVDGQHRSFLKTALRTRYEVVEAPTAVAALRACANVNPAVFVLGMDVGLMSPQFLARKLRERKELSNARIVLVASKTAPANPEAFDGVISKTLVPSEFMERFDQIVEPLGDLETSDDAYAGDPFEELTRTVEGAFEQAIAMMTGVPATLTRSMAALSAGQVKASFDIDTDAGAARLMLRASVDHACAVRSMMPGMAEGENTAENAVEALVELANAMANDITLTIESRGGRAAATAAEGTVDGAGEARKPGDVVIELKPESDAFSLAAVVRQLSADSSEASSEALPA